MTEFELKFVGLTIEQAEMHRGVGVVFNYLKISEERFPEMFFILGEDGKIAHAHLGQISRFPVSLEFTEDDPIGKIVVGAPNLMRLISAPAWNAPVIKPPSIIRRIINFLVR